MVPGHPGSPVQGSVKWLCVCVLLWCVLTWIHCKNAYNLKFTYWYHIVCFPSGADKPVRRKPGTGRPFCYLERFSCDNNIETI